MEFSKVLTHWYSINKRELPWRKTKNPYYIWLSEIILQQTQIKQGLPYYEAFVKRFPTVFDLADASEQEVLKLWQGLGYYSRARNLHASAKHIAKELNGVFPTTYKELIKLKGVGDYTASAIASICFHEPEAVVDGNVYRVLSRYFGITIPINSTEGIKHYKALASELIDVNKPGDHNQALMEFGATQCKPSAPNCHECPLSQSCLALKKGLVSTLPIKLKKTKVTKKHFNFLVVYSPTKEVIFEQRQKKGIWQNLYQFPLIETEKKLSVKAFRNYPQIKDYFKNSIYDFSLYNTEPIVHKLSHQHLNIRFWIVEVDHLPKEGVPISDLKEYPTPIVLGNFIEQFQFPV
ncbi:A/G-specific adenine glycosylase [Psychroserpens sp. XS_ASV72]|uniref:A/G-specific adenine glycosylase n=1 Tax=Psychroserpens sp. XS_ASV72 TaxID=3241293 RepID=UPI003514BB22